MRVEKERGCPPDTSSKMGTEQEIKVPRSGISALPLISVKQVDKDDSGYRYRKEDTEPADQQVRFSSLSQRPAENNAYRD